MTTDRTGPDRIRPGRIRPGRIGPGRMGPGRMGPGRFRPGRLALRVALALSGWPALAATALPGGSPLRWIPVLLFVCLGPGLALLHPQRGPLRPAARIEAVALTAPLSLSVGVTAATTLFLTRGFSATAFLVALAAVTTVAAALPGLPLPAATRGAAGHTSAAHTSAARSPAAHSGDPDPGTGG